MKEIVNLFFDLNNLDEKKRAEKFCQLEAAAPFNPRLTRNEGRAFLVIEFPVYTGHDKLRQKPALESLFLLGAVLGEMKGEEKQ